MHRTRTLALAAALVLLPGALLAQRGGIYHSGWIDHNHNGRKDPYEDPSLPVEKRVDDLLSRMTLQEKAGQMTTLYGYQNVLRDALPTPAWKDSVWVHGLANIDEHLSGRDSNRKYDTPYAWPPSAHAKALNTVQRWFIEQTRLGIPVDFTMEGIRGLAHEKATSFPAQIGVGSTWDVDLVSKIGHVTGREARALGYTNVYSPILDIARDPRWGRTVESYGESPFLTALYGVAEVEGLQAEGVASTMKHFAVYSIPEGGRDGSVRKGAHATWREVEELYLEPFREAVEQGHAMGAMATYADYDGIPIGGSYKFLTQILREEFGFDGYVVSDSGVMERLFDEAHWVAPSFEDAVRQTTEAGIDVYTNFDPPEKFIEPLIDLVKKGQLSERTVDARVRDVLRVKFRLGLFDHPFVQDPAHSDRIVHDAEAQALSLRAARESMVLLKNEGGVLPLKKSVRSIAVIGPNADADYSLQSRYGPQHMDAVTVLEGIRAAVGAGTKVTYAKGVEIKDANFPESDVDREPPSAEVQRGIDAAVAAARAAEVAVVVVGDDRTVVGESLSRVNLDLPGYQEQLVEAVQATGTPTVVVLLNGRPLTINWIDKHVPAILEGWFPGEYAGTAVADVLFGDYNPGGKLSITFPKSVGQIPLAFPHEVGTWGKGRARVSGPLYPFGYGLSYTTFAYSNLQVTPQTQRPQGPVTVSFDVKNTGSRAGDEVAQLYIRDVFASVSPYEKLLRGFQRVHLEPGESRHLSFTLGPKDLRFLDRDFKWVVEPGTFNVMAGSSSEDIRLKGSFEIVGDKLEFGGKHPE
ncbi:MAG TPA: glycoside hydrolase family 3 N-terminal domain-containing protein [Longimicrobiaceae bacterium]|nr:glycoside hydrolase family 3 N-terminal domain-containing protein [Longimicrobiaceae bacterium]